MPIEPIRVDIVSDVVCPWCIIGYRQLVMASKETCVPIVTFWHPFELNPDMPRKGELLSEHIARKYGSTPEQSAAARARLVELGAELGIAFAFSPESRIYNTFQAHQLLHWAAQAGRAQDLKLALFESYFARAQDISDPEILIATAALVGLNGQDARAVLAESRFGETVREKEAFWTSRGVSGVPTMLFDARIATSGAQGVDTFSTLLLRLAREPREVAV